MTHPEDLLAEYVDGTLPDTKRAVVGSHLASCATCREDVELAAGATRALAEVPEVPLPLGVTARVVAEAEAKAPRPRAPGSFRWAAGLAVAASVILVAAIIAPRIIGDGEQQSAIRRAGGGGAAEMAPAASPTTALPSLEKLDRDLTANDLQQIAAQAASASRASVPASPKVAYGVTDQASAQPALDCLSKSGATVDEQNVLARILEARYQSSPAYFGVFLQGPGAGQPPDHVVVWVASKQDCSILTIVSQPIH